MKAYVVGVAIGLAGIAMAGAEPFWKAEQGRCMTPVHSNRSALHLDADMLDALRSVGITPKSGFSDIACRERASVARPPAAKIYLAGQPP